MVPHSSPEEREVPVSDSAARLAARYGTPRSPRRRALSLVPVVLVVALALGYLLVIAVQHSTPDAKWGLLGFTVNGDRGVTVRWQVERDPSRQISCELEAEDFHHVTVGRRTVVVPAGAPARQDREAYLSTTATAVAAQVLSCS